MEFERKTNDRASVTFTTDELRLLNNALNEVCNGIDLGDDEFQTRLGVSRTAARKLLKSLGAVLTELAKK